MPWNVAESFHTCLQNVNFFFCLQLRYFACKKRLIVLHVTESYAKIYSSGRILCANWFHPLECEMFLQVPVTAGNACPNWSIRNCTLPFKLRAKPNIIFRGNKSVAKYHEKCMLCVFKKVITIMIFDLINFLK